MTMTKTKQNVLSFPYVDHSSTLARRVESPVGLMATQENESVLSIYKKTSPF